MYFNVNHSVPMSEREKPRMSADQGGPIWLRLALIALEQRYPCGFVERNVVYVLPSAVSALVVTSPRPS